MKTTTRNNLGYVGLMVVLSLLFIGCASSDKKPVSVPVEAKGTVQQKPTIPQPAETSQPAPSATLPSDVKGLIQQAVENSVRAKSFKSNMLMEIEMAGMKMSFTCDIKKYNELFYMKGEMMGMVALESYSDGKNIAVKDQMSQKWRRGPANQQHLMSLLEQIQRKIFLEHIQSASLAGEEKDCQIIEASVNPDVLKNIIEKEKLPMMEMEGVSFDGISLKMWIGKEDRLFYKTVCSIESTVDMGMFGSPSSEEGEEEEKDVEDDEEENTEPDTPTFETPSRPGKGKMKASYIIDVTFSDYNKAAPIVIPPEVKRIWESPIENDLEEGAEEESPKQITPPPSKKPTKK